MIETFSPLSHEEWLSLRAHTIGASEAAAVLGADRWQTPYELWARKSGLAPNINETAAMRRGKLLEPVAIQLLREARPDWDIRPNAMPNGKFYRDLEARMSCTPDCFVVDGPKEGLGICQIKTVNHHVFHTEWVIDGEIEVPVRVGIQTLQEMALTGASWGCVLAIVGFDLDVHIIDIDQHPGILSKLRRAVEDFWRRVRENDPYPPDYARDGDVIRCLYANDGGGTIDLSANDHARKLVARWDALKSIEAASSDAAKERKIIDAELIHLLSNATRGTLADGRIVEAKTVCKNGYTVKPSTFRAVKIRERKVA